jgi:hypothetical protein
MQNSYTEWNHLIHLFPTLLELFLHEKKLHESKMHPMKLNAGFSATSTNMMQENFLTLLIFAFTKSKCCFQKNHNFSVWITFFCHNVFHFLHDFASFFHFPIPQEHLCLVGTQDELLSFRKTRPLNIAVFNFESTRMRNQTLFAFLQGDDVISCDDSQVGVLERTTFEPA